MFIINQYKINFLRVTGKLSIKWCKAEKNEITNKESSSNEIDIKIKP